MTLMGYSKTPPMTARHRNRPCGEGGTTTGLDIDPLDPRREDVARVAAGFGSPLTDAEERFLTGCVLTALERLLDEDPLA